MKQQAGHSHLQLTSRMINSSHITRGKGACIKCSSRAGIYRSVSAQHKQSSLTHDHHNCLCTMRCRRGCHVNLTGLRVATASWPTARLPKYISMKCYRQSTLSAMCVCVHSAHDRLCTVHSRMGRHLMLICSHSCSSKACNYRTHRPQFTPKSSHTLTDISLVDRQRLSVHCVLQEGCLYTVCHRRGWHLGLIGLHSCSSKTGNCSSQQLQSAPKSHFHSHQPGYLPMAVCTLCVAGGVGISG